MVTQTAATVIIATNFGSFSGRIIAGTNQYCPVAYRLQYLDGFVASITVARPCRPSPRHSTTGGSRPRAYGAALAAHWLIAFDYLFPICPKSLIAFPEANSVIDLVAGLAPAGFD